MTLGVAETDTEIWDIEGNFVAMARQTYKVRMPKDGSQSAITIP